MRVAVDNKINSKLFTNGYGFGCHSYIITRMYIQSIINKFKKLPEPDGKHIDYIINVDMNHILYTERIFYTNENCSEQLIGSESDNS